METDRRVTVHPDAQPRTVIDLGAYSVTAARAHAAGTAGITPPVGCGVKGIARIHVVNTSGVARNIVVRNGSLIGVRSYTNSNVVQVDIVLFNRGRPR